MTSTETVKSGARTKKNAGETAKSKAVTYKYGVKTLAESLGIAESSVRVGLRKHKVEKAEGNVYGWNTLSDLEKVKNILRPKKAA